MSSAMFLHVGKIADEVAEGLANNASILGDPRPPRYCSNTRRIRSVADR